MIYVPKYRFDEIAINSTEKKKPIEADKDTYIGLEHLDSGCLEVTHWGADVAPIGDKLVMRKGDVLFGRRRAYQKKVAIAPFDGIFSAHGMVLRPIESVISKEFFPFFISSDYFLDAAIKISVGSLSPTINWRDLAKLEFQIPSLEEQEAISSILWAMNRLKVAYTNLLQQADALVQSQFVEEIQSLIDADATVPLDDLIDDDRPITYGILKPGTGFAGGIPVVKVKDMRDGIIDESDLLLTSPDIDQAYQRSKLRAGDLLISIRGSIGRMAEVPDSLQDANITQDTARLSVKPAYSRVYLRGVLESAPMQRDMEKNIRGVAVKGINIGYLRNLPIPMPGRDRQDALAQLYIQTDKSKLAIRQALESLEKSRSAIMTKVFG